MFSRRNQADDEFSLRWRVSDYFVEVGNRINSSSIDSPDSIARAHRKRLKRTFRRDEIYQHAAPARDVVDAKKCPGCSRSDHHCDQHDSRFPGNNCLSEIEKENDAGRLDLRDTNPRLLGKKRGCHGPQKKQPNRKVEGSPTKTGFSGGESPNQPSRRYDA